MLWDPRTLQDLRMRATRDQGAGRQLAALGIPSASRKYAAARRMAGDHGEGAPVLLGDGIRIEQRAWQDMRRGQRGVRGATGPRGAGHTEQAHPGTGRTREVARWTPDGRCTRIASVGQAQVL